MGNRFAPVREANCDCLSGWRCKEQLVTTVVTSDDIKLALHTMTKRLDLIERHSELEWRYRTIENNTEILSRLSLQLRHAAGEEQNKLQEKVARFRQENENLARDIVNLRGQQRAALSGFD